METILLFFLKKVCHILLTNSSLELISTYLHLSVAQMLKPSKFMAQLHYNKWSDAADCFTFFEIFSCKIGAPHVSSCSGIKVTEGFSIISNLVVTTRITISYSRANFFLKQLFEQKQSVKSTLRSKNYFQFTKQLGSFYISCYTCSLGKLSPDLTML